MKNSSTLITLAAALCLLLFASQAKAQSLITGSTSLDYDPDTNLVTGYATTELDYAAQDYYQAYVASGLTDANGNLLSSSYEKDMDWDGTATVTTQAAGEDQMQYTNTGTHVGVMVIQDYDLNGRSVYYDYYNFGYYQTESEYHLFWYAFVGYGPLVVRHAQNLSLGKTYATAQAKPQVAIQSATFNPAQVDKTNGTTDLNVNVSASQTMQAGDQVVVEVTKTTPNGDIVYAQGQTATATVSPGNSVTAKITMSTSATNTYSGNVTFSVRIIDVLRPNSNGGATSIFNNVTIGGQPNVLPDPLRVKQ